MDVNADNGVSYVENLTLEGRNDIDGYGNDLNNILVGSSGSNKLHGGDGDDELGGGGGHDTLDGGGGDDTLSGDLGSNDYVGGMGADTHHAGNSNDEESFIFYISAESPAYHQGDRLYPTTKEMRYSILMLIRIKSYLKRDSSRSRASFRVLPQPRRHSGFQKLSCTG